MFNLWSPVLEPSGTLSFDVTRANMPRVQDASEAWIRECLLALNLGESTPLSWRVTPVRAHFYSDYPAEPEWRDRWPIAWSVEVTLKAVAGRLAPAGWELPVHVDALDETWDGDLSDSRHDGTALVMAAAPRRKGLLDPLMRNFELAAGIGSLCHTATRPCPPAGEQLRLFIDVPDFAGAVGSLDELVRKNRSLGSAVNWRQLEA